MICSAPVFAVQGFDIASRMLDARDLHVVWKPTSDEDGAPLRPMLSAPQSIGFRYFYNRENRNDVWWKVLPESYLLRDSTYQHYIGSVLGQPDMERHFALHQFLELLDIAHLPGWPAYMKRGRNGLPSKDQLKEFFPEANRIGQFPTKEHAWVTLIIRPLIWEAHVDQAAEMTAEQVIRRFIEEVFIYATMSEGFEYGKNQGERLIVTVKSLLGKASTQVDFKKYTFKDYMRQRARNPDLKHTPMMLRLKDFTPAEQALFLFRLNQFLTKFETLWATGVTWDLFGPTVVKTVSETEPLAVSRVSMRMKFSLQTVVNRLRGEVESYVEGRIGGPYSSFSPTRAPGPLLPVPAIPSAPLVALPGKLDCRTLDPLPGSPSEFEGPRDYLFAFALMSEAERETCLQSVRAHWIAQRPEMALEDVDVVDRLMFNAKVADSKHQLICSDVSSEAIPRIAQFDDRLLQPQFQLNEVAAGGVLVVYSPNDREGLVARNSLERMKKVLKVHTLEIELPQSKQLQPGHWEQIKAAAAAAGVRFVAVLECGVISPEVRAGLQREAGLTVFQFDHHASAAGDRRHPFSAVEQLWHFMGYAPSVFEWIEAAFDRSGAAAFRDLDFSREDVMRWVSYQPGGRRLNDQAAWLLGRETGGEAETEVRVYEVEPFPGSRREGFYPFEMLNYPEPTNVLLVGPERIWFLGQPDLVEALREGFRSQSAELFQYCGGESRVGYWGCSLRRPGRSVTEVKDHMTFEIRRILEGAIKKNEQTPCWKTISHWGR